MAASEQGNAAAKQRIEAMQKTKNEEKKALMRKNANATVTTIESLLPRFKMVLPPHVSPERFARVCITAITQDEKLLQCTPKSILQSCLTAAQLGLEPNKQIGEGYFIPFGTECIWITGYKGYLTLARNSGEVSNISAGVVYSGDEFEFEYGLNDKLRHKPKTGEQRDEDVTHAWAMVRYKDGSYGFVVLTLAEIIKRRNESKSAGGTSSPWLKWFPEMCRKTAIRSLSNQLPKSVMKALAIDNAIDQGKRAFLDDANQGDFVIDVEDETQEADQEATQAIPKTSSRLDAFAANVDVPEPAPPVNEGNQDIPFVEEPIYDVNPETGELTPKQI